jgi:hypothetical protein
VKVLDSKQWASETFQNCSLGDPRRTNRLLKVAEGMLDAPEQSLPSQFTDWHDVKAAYRFFDTEQVTFDAICLPHWEQTRQTKPGCYVFISDTTDINLTTHPSTKGLGILGDGKGRGLQLHPCLAYSVKEKQVVGLAGAVTQYRAFRPKKETRAQSLARNRESDVWGRIVDQVGSAPDGSQWIHVFDRGGDYFEAMCRVKLTKNDWVIRASKLNRKVMNDRGEKVTLTEAIKEATELGTFSMELRSTPRHAARTANLTVSYCEVTFLAPARKSPWLRQCPLKALKMRVVIAREMNPPNGNRAICWVILTSLAVECFDDAWKVLEYYEYRWMIEEYNRVAKSGCSMEKHALRTAERLEAIIGLTSIIAVRLFQLKLIGRNQPEAKAATHVPSTWLQGLKLMRPKIKLTEMTVYEFFRQLAMLGGFLGRKHDGEPGWLTIWRGYRKLHQTNVGIELGKRLR